MEIELCKDSEKSSAKDGNSVRPTQIELNGWQYFVRAFGLYATFSGRARRREFWYFYLFITIIQALLVLIDIAMGLDLPDMEPGEGGLLSGLFAIATIVPFIAVLSRRLHDVGRSAKWILAPYISFIPVFALMGFLDAFWPFCITWAIGFMILCWTLKDSQPGTNKWGANPKGF